jgi:hypothetical protein
MAAGGRPALIRAGWAAVLAGWDVTTSHTAAGRRPASAPEDEGPRHGRRARTGTHCARILHRGATRSAYQRRWHGDARTGWIADLKNISGLICSKTAWTKSALTATNRCPMPCKAIEAVLALSARRHAHSTPPPRRLPAPGCSREPQNLPVALSALPDEPWRTAQCAPHPPPAVTSSPCIP